MGDNFEYLEIIDSETIKKITKTNFQIDTRESSASLEESIRLGTKVGCPLFLNTGYQYPKLPSWSTFQGTIAIFC